MPDADEQQLLDQVRNGNQNAYSVLVRRHMKQAYEVAFGFLRHHDDAEDVTQEAFVRAYHSLRSFRGEAEFSTWLHRIVVNLCLNRSKHRRRRAAHEIPHEMAVAMAPGEETNTVEESEVRYHFERALHELPTMQRAVVILRHVDGLSTKQVGCILQCSEGTVKTHLFRGLKKLQKRLHYLRDGR